MNLKQRSREYENVYIMLELSHYKIKVVSFLSVYASDTFAIVTTNQRPSLLQHILSKIKSLNKFVLDNLMNFEVPRP